MRLGTLGVVSVWDWCTNAARRTARSLSEGQAAPDDDFARRALRPEELRLYLGMDARDRDHAVEVTRSLLTEFPDASPQLVRAALLHDVGKQVRPYRVWERILAHLWAPPDVPAEPRLRGVRGAWQVRVHHASYGAAMLRAAGGSEEVARLIEQHDAPEPGSEAWKLHRVDGRT